MLTSLRVRTQGAPSFAPSVRAGLAGVLAVAACALWLPAAAHGAELPVYTAQPALERPAAIARLKDLIAEALQNNPELRGAAKEREDIDRVM